MILMYHKVMRPVESRWCVSPESFRRQMEELRARGMRAVYLDDYNPLDPNEVVITFDDVFSHLVKNAVPILKDLGFPFELFVVGDTSVECDPGCTASLATFEELRAMVAAGGRLEWHTMSHANLREPLSVAQLEREVSVPEAWRQLDPRGFRWFAYPYGGYSESAEQLVAKRFSGAVIIGEGRSTPDRYHLQRYAVFESTCLRYLGYSKLGKLMRALIRMDFSYLTGNIRVK